MYQKGPIWRKFRDELMYLAESSRAEEQRDPHVYDGNWGQWMPMTNCLLLHSDSEIIRKARFEDERNFTKEYNYYKFEDDYTKWIDSWKAIENWQKPENWTVPSNWPTVEEMVQANDNKPSDFYVAQFRIRFCNDDL